MLVGVIMILVAHGHYTVDVLIAYYVTTNLWYIYHTMANNSNLKVRSIFRSLQFENYLFYDESIRFSRNSIIDTIPVTINVMILTHVYIIY